MGKTVPTRTFTDLQFEAKTTCMQLTVSELWHPKSKKNYTATICMQRTIIRKQAYFRANVQDTHNAHHVPPGKGPNFVHTKVYRI